MSSILDNLNSQQKKAALQTHGPQIIFAGAGSGKTRTLTHKIAYMCSIGINPEHILAITFTTKAASEMKKRIRELIGYKSSSVTTKTFHSFCVQLLREEHNNTFIIYSRLSNGENFPGFYRGGGGTPLKHCKLKVKYIYYRLF